CALDERISRWVSGPRLAKRTCEREQYWTPCQRDHCVFATNDMTARIHDECPRFQYRFNLLEPEVSLLAADNQARRRRVKHKGCAFHLRHQCGDACLAGGMLGPSERSARDLDPKASDCDPGNDQFVGGPRRGRKGSRIEPSERMLGLVETPDQEK